LNLILFDDSNFNNLLPFTYTRPVADIRIGILTIREKWEKALDFANSYSIVKAYLSEKYPVKVASENILINGSVCPDEETISEILNLRENELLISEDETIIAIKISAERLQLVLKHASDKDQPFYSLLNQFGFKKIKACCKPFVLKDIWEIFLYNGPEIKKDFLLLTKGRKSKEISDSNKIIGLENIFIEEGAVIECSVINASSGYVYIGKNVEIMEGSLIRGPFAICEGSVLKMGAKIYGATTIGPHSKVGGEINNSVIFGYSNKAHDGFLGNSVIGEWCNLGADTNNSNLKNNYSEVKVWNQSKRKLVGSRLQFCGLFMGDHSKSAINTMFNTGTVAEVCTNIFGAGFPEKFIPSFTWGGVDSMTTFTLEKAFEVAKRVQERRNIEFSKVDEDIFTYIYKLTQDSRHTSI
jgi:UDP-N-acetylglucosamine diphosphorylase/glucosamine-1-phosphate N-acetyltransferase